MLPGSSIPHPYCLFLDCFIQPSGYLLAEVRHSSLPKQITGNHWKCNATLCFRFTCTSIRLAKSYGPPVSRSSYELCLESLSGWVGQSALHRTSPPLSVQTDGWARQITFWDSTELYSGEICNGWSRQNNLPLATFNSQPSYPFVILKR